jgi:N-acetylmuramoyl-L-alanine amidase
MKQAFDKFVPRVAKLDKHKYAAYVDIHVDHLWEMAVAGCGVRICGKRREAEKAARQLVTLARKSERAGANPRHR